MYAASTHSEAYLEESLFLSSQYALDSRLRLGQIRVRTIHTHLLHHRRYQRVQEGLCDHKPTRK